MARIDDYKQARAISKKSLLEKDPGIIADFSGAELKKLKYGLT